MIFWFDFCLFLMKVYLILMKLIKISWNFIFWKLMKTLILKYFEIRWNKWCPNQVLRKLVKLHNSQNVNQYDYINVYRHSRIFSWMSFFVQKTKVHPKFTLLLFETSKGYFSCCLIYFFSSIDISLRYLDVTMSKCFWNGLKRKTCLFSKMLEFMRSLMDIIFLNKYVIM